jgi:hypothetical protein
MAANRMVSGVLQKETYSLPVLVWHKAIGKEFLYA